MIARAIPDNTVTNRKAATSLSPIFSCRYIKQIECRQGDANQYEYVVSTSQFDSSDKPDIMHAHMCVVLCDRLTFSLLFLILNGWKIIFAVLPHK